MKEAVGERCKVKAAGGVRTLETLEELYSVGVRRFGISVQAAQNILAEAFARTV
jgi:deoxyribose-phosphate aldolase